MNTLTIKVGTMPGKLTEVAIERGTTVRRAFEIAEISLGNHETRLDGNKVDLDSTIESGNLLVAMKMIKGNANVIKVGTMPGKLVEVELRDGDTARDLFSRASIELGNHEVRLDGNKIELSNSVNNGNLLVAMKMIKGNASAWVSELTESEIETILEIKLPIILSSDEVKSEVSGVTEVLGNIVDTDMFLSIYSLNEIEPPITRPSEMKTLEMPFDESIPACDMVYDIKATKVIEDRIARYQESYQMYLKMATQESEKIYVLKSVLEEIIKG